MRSGDFIMYAVQVRSCKYAAEKSEELLHKVLKGVVHCSSARSYVKSFIQSVALESVNQQKTRTATSYTYTCIYIYVCVYIYIYVYADLDICHMDDSHLVRCHGRSS